ncbi:hypothetical protein [Streptomyces sp. H51]|uniref:hypothetical protein n=1 Tax=Streptomyces sp. H51 TaxID=3111770 RepID=UPI002D787284|nr:hypothetical protein [Streptomyces sp. H51]
MRRWSSVVPGRGRGSGTGTGRRDTALPADGANGTGNRGTGGPPVEDIDGVLLVRSVEDDSFPLEVVAEVAGAVSGEEDVVTVIVGSTAGGGAPDADLWARLGALLDSLRARGSERVRLVMSGAGDDRPERPCVARRIADAWELEVTAPDGAVLITPGGALFVHGDSRPGCGWWRFAPGEKPRKLGRRAPAPAWEEALGAVPERTGGCVVDRVPAGVAIRPAQAPGPAPDDLCYSVPVDFERLTVLVGAPQAEDVAADEVAAVLAGLPEAQRARARLAPGGRRDLLRLGQSVADLLATEVEVLTGLPLLDDHAPPGTPPRPTLVGLDGRPSWRPFVSSVICGPVDSKGRAPVPRPTEVHPPDWILGGGERGTVRLTDRWQATVTRAGLALWAQDGPRPGPLGPAVDPETCAIELGMPGQPLDGSLLPALSRLLHGLGTDLRSRTTLLVRGRLLAGDGALRRLAADHGVPNIRYVTTGRPPRPGAATGRPVVTAQPGHVSRSGGMPSHRSGTAVALPTAGPGVPSPAPAPAARPDAPQGVGAAEVSGVAGGSPVAGPVAPPGPRADGGAPGRPTAGAGVPVPPVSLREGGPVPPPDSVLGGGVAEVGVDAVGPGGASGALPGAPPEAVEPDEAEPGGTEPGGAEPGGAEPGGAEPGGAEPGAVVPTASSEPRPRPRLGEGAASAVLPEGGADVVSGQGVSASVVLPEGGADVVSGRKASVPAALPEAGAGPGVSRARSAAASPDGVRAGADGEPGDGGVGGAARAAAGGDGPGPDGDRAVRAEPGERPQRRVAEAPAPPRAVLPFVPGHISGAAERAAFRDLAAGSWEGHAAAVSRVLTRMPALRGHELEAARTDLIAAHAYLTAEEGPLHHPELIRDLHTGEGRLLPYAGCLASALRRLPSYRGVALRGGDADGPEPAVGALLHDPAPVSALAGASALPAGAPGRYAIWSVTGRKVRQLLDRPGGSTEAYEEIVFVPGTGFRVLGVRATPEGRSVVLLRELPGNATAYMDGAEEMSGLDLKALAHLEEALAKGFRGGEVPQWPERCAGPIGQDG